MEPQYNHAASPGIKKLIECYLALFAIYVFLYLLIGILLCIPWLATPMKQWFFASPFVILLFSTLSLFCLPPLLFTIWISKEEKGKANSQRIHGILKEVIAGGVAGIIFLFIYSLLLIKGRPEELTSASHSISNDLTQSTLFRLIVVKDSSLWLSISAPLLISGMLILYRATRGIGCLISMFLMVALCSLEGSFLSPQRDLISFTVMILFYFIPCIYLLILEWRGNIKKIVQGLFVWSGWNFSFVWKLVLFLMAVILFIQPELTSKKRNPLVGSWNVVHMERGGANIAAGAWESDSLAWSKVYVDGSRLIQLNPHPYRFDQSKSATLLYNYDTVTNRLLFINMAQAKDTIAWKVTSQGSNQMEWTGKWGADSIRMLLAREQ